MDESIQAIKDAAEAAKTAAQVAAKAVEVASSVANEAQRVASLAAVESAKISENIVFIKAEITDIKSKLDNKYVTIESFLPVRNIVYGLVGLILVSVVGALIALVVIHR